MQQPRGMILARLGDHGARDPDLAVGSCMFTMVHEPTTRPPDLLGFDTRHMPAPNLLDSLDLLQV